MTLHSVGLFGEIIGTVVLPTVMSIAIVVGTIGMGMAVWRMWRDNQ